MTTQEKIDQLATAALRSAPPAPVAPKPTTYMAPFEKPRIVAMVGAPAVTAPMTVVPATTVAPAVAAIPAAPFKDEPDPELRAQIEQREVRIKKDHQLRSLAVTLVALAILGSAGFFGYKSPAARAEIAALAPALRTSVDDLKMIGSLTRKYDEQLEKIAVHGQHIDEATRAMGTDPTTVSAEENAETEAEMAGMMGGEGRTTAQRDRDLQAKFGVVGKLIGTK